MTSRALNWRAMLKGSLNVVEPVATRPISSVFRAMGARVIMGSRVIMSDSRVRSACSPRKSGGEQERELSALCGLGVAHLCVEAGVVRGIDPGGPPGRA